MKKIEGSPPNINVEVSTTPIFKLERKNLSNKKKIKFKLFSG